MHLNKTMVYFVCISCSLTLPMTNLFCSDEMTASTQEGMSPRTRERTMFGRNTPHRRGMWSPHHVSQEEMSEARPPSGVTIERLHEILDPLRERHPEQTIAFEAQMNDNPEFARFAGRHIMSEVRRVERAKRHDSSLADRLYERVALEMKSYVLAWNYRTTTNEKQRSSIEETLRAVLNQAFPLRCLEMEERIQVLSSQLQKLKDNLERQKQRKDAVIERRLEALTGRPDELVW